MPCSKAEIGPLLSYACSSREERCQGVYFQPVSLTRFHQGTTLQVRSNSVYCHSVDSLFAHDRRNVEMS
jgi:hypothetical protein